MLIVNNSYCQWYLITFTTTNFNATSPLRKCQTWWEWQWCNVRLNLVCGAPRRKLSRVFVVGLQSINRSFPFSCWQFLSSKFLHIYIFLFIFIMYLYIRFQLERITLQPSFIFNSTLDYFGSSFCQLSYFDAWFGTLADTWNPDINEHLEGTTIISWRRFSSTAPFVPLCLHFLVLKASHI